MSGADINAKVIAGLARAKDRTGGGTSEVYLKSVTTTEGNPFTGGAVVETSYTLLERPLWVTIGLNLIDGTNVKSGDRGLVLDSTVLVKIGDVISILDGGTYTDYNVVQEMPVDVTNVLLMQEFIVRKQ